MATQLSYSIHSITDAVASIDQGEDPWFAFGCFLHDWWCDAVDYRQDLISTPPVSTTTAEGRRWAALFAATVEELCSKNSFPCPEWIHKQDYELEHPWFHSSQLPSVTGYFQPHLSHLRDATSSSVAAYWITSMNCNKLLT